MTDDEFVAVQRKRDGLFLQANKQYHRNPAFLPLNKARLFVRIDLGRDLEEFDFLDRDTLLHRKSAK